MSTKAPKDQLASVFAKPPLRREGEIVDAIAKLRSGHPSRRSREESAERSRLSQLVMEDYNLRQWTGKRHSPATLSWLASCFEQILTRKAKTLQQAFGIKPLPAGRPKEEDKQIDIARWVRLACTKCGYEPAAAIKAAAQSLEDAGKPLDQKIIERYCLRWNMEAEDMNPAVDWEELYLTRDVPWLEPSRPWPLPPRGK